MDLNTIMSNIYGVGAPQDLASLGFTGGNKKIQYHRAKVKYLDADPEAQPRPEPALELSFKSIMTGGAVKPQPADILNTPLNIDNSDLRKFVDNFCLHYVFANAKSHGIYVIPSSATLNKLVESLNTKLSEAGKIKPETAEAGLFLYKKKFTEHLNYIFDVFDKSKNNRKENYETTITDKVLLRKNRAGNIYYMKITGEA